MSQFSSPLMTRYDLHCHTQASDGDLSPIEVVERAIEMGLTYFLLLTMIPVKVLLRLVNTFHTHNAL